MSSDLLCMGRRTLRKTFSHLNKLRDNGLWVCPPDLWVFFSGMVASIGANVFTSRALTGIGSKTMWLAEFLLFILSSVSCFFAGAVHRRVEETWKDGGELDDAEIEEGFREDEMKKYKSHAVSAVSLFVLGMLLVLGWNFASLLEVTSCIVTTLLIGFERCFNIILEAMNYITAYLLRTLGGQ